MNFQSKVLLKTTTNVSYFAQRATCIKSLICSTSEAQSEICFSVDHLCYLCLVFFMFRVCSLGAPPTNVGGALLFLACPSVCLSVRPSVRCHSNSVTFNRISSKFHIWIASINLSFKFEYGFCPTSDNQDGRQNGRHLSISAVVVTLTQSF